MSSDDPLSIRFYRDFLEYAPTKIERVYGDVSDEVLKRFLDPEIRRWVERALEVTTTPTLPITDKSLTRASWELLREEQETEKRALLECLYEYAQLEWFYRPTSPHQPPQERMPGTDGTDSRSAGGIVQRVLTSPQAWIVVAGVLGFLFDGMRGLIIGLVGGLAVTLVVGVLVRLISGGSVPRRVRRSLVTNVMAKHGEAVKAAFPNLSGDRLFNAMESEIEKTVETAITLSPSHGAAFAENVMRAALRERLNAEDDPDRRRMLKALEDQLLREWYGDSRG